LLVTLQQAVACIKSVIMAISLCTNTAIACLLGSAVAFAEPASAAPGQAPVSDLRMADVQPVRAPTAIQEVYDLRRAKKYRQALTVTDRLIELEADNADLKRIRDFLRDYIVYDTPRRRGEVPFDHYLLRAHAVRNGEVIDEQPPLSPIEKLRKADRLSLASRGDLLPQCLMQLSRAIGLAVEVNWPEFAETKVTNDLPVDMMLGNVDASLALDVLTRHIDMHLPDKHARTVWVVKYDRIWITTTADTEIERVPMESGAEQPIRWRMK